MKRSFVLSVFLSAAANLVAAQGFPTLTVKTFSVVSSLAAPPWTTSSDVMSQSEVQQKQTKTQFGTDQFVFEMIRKGESFDNWGMLYGLRAVHGQTGPLADLAKREANLVVQSCTKAIPQFSGASSEERQLFVVFCEGLKHSPHRGEVAFFNVQLRDETLVTNSLQIRMPSFSMSDPENLPLTVEQVGAGFVAVGSLQVLSLPSE